MDVELPAGVSGWGDPARRPGLSRAARRFLAAELGPLPSAPPAGPPRSLRVAGSRLPDPVRRALSAAVREEYVRVDPAERARHSAGKGYLDLVRLRSGEVAHLPDAVVFPGSAAEVAEVLRACAEGGVAVVPFGGGTSVVGGVTPLAGAFSSVISLDLARLDGLLEVDEESLLVRVQPGLTGPAAEARLRERGLTLGHFPQSFEFATLGGFAATRSAGQASTGYGRFDEMVVGLEMVTPAGTLRLGRGAASAAGPNLLGLLVGSEGVFGVVTELTLRVHRYPQVKRYEGLVFRSWEDGVAAVRELAQRGLAPTVTRLSDPDETRVSFAQSGGGGTSALLAYLRLRGAFAPSVAAGAASVGVVERGVSRSRSGRCLAIFGWEGSPWQVRAHRAVALKLVGAHGAIRLGRAVGTRWEHGRFAAPYLRDDLLDAGLLVETLETSAVWSRLAALHTTVRSALREALASGGTPPLILCHVSHVYPHGASLYFTVLAQQSDRAVAQWEGAKSAASRVIVASGATITHHHGVGLDHRDYLTEEIGDLGVAVLRSVKEVLDPVGIQNPGKLIPPGGGAGGGPGGGAA
ncbi:MAG: FAD-binding oxidoreductase [Mycobacteriales bacterium]